MTVKHENMSWQRVDGSGDPGPPISTTTRRVECVGPWFLSFCQPGPVSGAPHPRALSEPDEGLLLYSQDPDFGYLRHLDPKDWKNQDHYAVLGLKAMRHKATQDDVKKAYRAKMLMHHPDKRKHLVVRVEDDYFSCITRAWEVLGDPKTRRSYDSVDKTHDDSIPANNGHNKEHFYRVFQKAFARNAHWSKIQPVPALGTATSPREEVERFYSFWYDFQSWREFSYRGLDDERDVAWEKKMRRNEVTRVRKLVDLAYALDPRIAVFKREEQERKAAAKQLRKEQARARLLDAEKKVEAEEREARLEMERKEAEAKELQEALKVERNARKRALRGGRAALRKLVKAHGYYVVGAEELVPHMMGLEDIVDQTVLAEKLELLVQALKRCGRDAFLRAMAEAKCNSATTTSQSASKKDGSVSVVWTDDELKLLAKATKLYPSERKYRWELVADFVNQCAVKNAKTSKDAETKWSEVQSFGPWEDSRMASAVADGLESPGADNHEVDTRVVADEALAEETLERVWDERELAALQAATETYPAFTHGRWDKVAGLVGTRDRDECLKEAIRRAK